VVVVVLAVAEEAVDSAVVRIFILLGRLAKMATLTKSRTRRRWWLWTARLRSPSNSP
jgi:hypothetical protein